ncbi:MAG: hypothetical protein GX270_06250 [Clostridiaceae bacterium]|mgnify:CR=1 FL=1|jgi:chemotaxis protein histidine kinase CheA|nr:hypothetical protein [Clostridiaceae bacterium]
MKLKLLISKISLLVLITYMIMLCGCNQNKQSPDAQAKQVKTNEESDKVPKDLEEIENSIEKIIKVLEGPAASTKDEGEQNKQEEQEGQNQEKSSPPQGKESEDKDSENENKEDGGEQKDAQNSEQSKKADQDNDKAKQEKTAAPKDPWQEITSTINKLHYQWNGYIPSVTKKNASRELIDNFDNTLNALTSISVTKDKNQTLMTANNLYLFIPDFYMLYKTPTSPEIKRIRYYIRNAVLNGTILNWEQASKDVSNLKATWAIYKNTIDPNNQDLASKLDYSIYELEKVVNENNMYLTDIKGRIAISNTESVEKAAKENEKKE